jgi:hypothetical protein
MEMIWDKLGVRTVERNMSYWQLIIDGEGYDDFRAIMEYDIQKDSMLLLVRTSWMVCIKCSIPYGCDANQCSNRVFQRARDSNCSLCSSNSKMWGKRNEEKHKSHSNGNQYCFWGPPDDNHSHGERRHGNYVGWHVSNLPTFSMLCVAARTCA